MLKFPTFANDNSISFIKFLFYFILTSAIRIFSFISIFPHSFPSSMGKVNQFNTSDFWFLIRSNNIWCSYWFRWKFLPKTTNKIANLPISPVCRCQFAIWFNECKVFLPVGFSLRFVWKTHIERLPYSICSMPNVSLKPEEVPSEKVTAHWLLFIFLDISFIKQTSNWRSHTQTPTISLHYIQEVVCVCFFLMLLSLRSACAVDFPPHPIWLLLLLWAQMPVSKMQRRK